MTDIRIVRDYPHPPAKVWRALTDPALVTLWAMRPEGFAAVVGNRSRYYAKPQRGWRGFIECEVLEVRERELLRYSWVGNEGRKPTFVTYRLEPIPGGTRLLFEHTGFEGVAGFMLAKLIMAPGWRKMLSGSFEVVLRETDSDGNLLPQSKLVPKFPA
jgi:uncharacterized protein YndB with AHSA1/START domain